MSRDDLENPMKWSVAEFLREFQQILQLPLPGRVWWHDAPRRDQEIEDLGLTKPGVVKELLKMKVQHHHQGPEADDWETERCCVHKFKYPLAGGPLVYAKLGLTEHPKQRGTYIARIWSFKRWQA